MVLDVLQKYMPVSRCVLFMTDDGLGVYDVTPQAVRYIRSVPWAEANFEITVSALISEGCGGKPVVVLNDLVEQYYRKEKVPKVSPLDRKNMLLRRLRVAFPNYPVNGALPIRKSADTKTKAAADAGGLYLFCASPRSDSFKKVIAAVRRSLAPLTGFFMLPVESADMVVRLVDGLVKERGEKETPSWAVFMGQHAGGGLRQIVTKNGELALTRITPIVDRDEDPRKWAQDVANEFKATMGYISRFGYTARDGLEVMVVSSHEAGEALEELIDEPCHFTAMTAAEAAGLLGMRLGFQKDDRLADCLHAGWAGRKLLYTLYMNSSDIQRVQQPRQGAVAGIAGLTLSFAILTFLCAGQASSLHAASSNLEYIQKELATAKSVYEEEVQRKEDLGIDIRLILSSVEIYEDIRDLGVDPLYVVPRIARALGPDIRANKIEMKGASSLGAAAARRSPPLIGRYALHFSVPGTVDVDESNRDLVRLRNRLRAEFPSPGYNVDVAKRFAGLGQAEIFKAEAGAGGDARNKVYKAEIEIEVLGDD